MNYNLFICCEFSHDDFTSHLILNLNLNKSSIELKLSMVNDTDLSGGFYQHLFANLHDNHRVAIFIVTTYKSL